MQKKIGKYSLQELQAKLGNNSALPGYFHVHFDNEDDLPDEPYRTQSYGICLLHKGTTYLTTNLVEHTVNAPAIISMGPEVIRRWVKTKREVVSDVIFFTREFISSMHSSLLMERFQFFNVEQRHCLALDELQYEELSQIYKIILKSNERHSTNTEITRALIYVLLLQIEAYHNALPLESQWVSSQPVMILNFKSLLAKEFQAHRDVNFYADKLFTTPKNLSEQLKKHTGRTAGEMIDEMVMLEAKILLQHKDLTVAQVAEQLNFSDQSIFGKFFKRLTGYSPSDYRSTLPS